MGILIAYYNTKTGLVGKVMGVSTNEVPLEFSPWQSISLSFFFFFFFFLNFISQRHLGWGFKDRVGEKWPTPGGFQEGKRHI